VMRMNLIIVACLAFWSFRGNKMGSRLLLTAMLVPALWVNGVAQRRAAIISLAVGLIVLSIVLFWRQRTTFFKLVPLAGMAIAAYVGAFWTSTSSVGFPAQALKSVIAPAETTERNQASDLYRTIETFDLNFTIRSNKLMGLGLGKNFYRPIPLPSIDNFGFNSLIPHNSLLFVWVMFGFGGFVALFCLLGRSMMLGSVASRLATGGRNIAMITTFAMTVVMFIIFTAVDISWTGENLVMLGTAIAALALGSNATFWATSPLPTTAAPAPPDGSVGAPAHNEQRAAGERALSLVPALD
jgi:hypothetical protein